MRLNTSTLFVVSSVLSVGSSLPFFRAEIAWLEPLLRRATYSVVAVDGGSTTANAKPSTIIQTITEAPATATKTILETDRITLQPSTVTQVVSGPETIKTFIVTVSQPASIVTTTAYAIVNVSPTTSALAQSTPSVIYVSSPVLSKLNPTSTESSSTTISSSTTSTPSTTSATSYTSSSIISLITSTITKSATATFTSTQTYDDGQWHTTYPHWTNGTASMTKPSLPARTASPVRLDADALTKTASGLFVRAIAFGTTMLQELGLLGK